MSVDIIIRDKLRPAPGEAWFNIAVGPRKPEGSLGRTAQDGHLDSHTAPELGYHPHCTGHYLYPLCLFYCVHPTLHWILFIPSLSFLLCSSHTALDTVHHLCLFHHVHPTLPSLPFSPCSAHTALSAFFTVFSPHCPLCLFHRVQPTLPSLPFSPCSAHTALSAFFTMFSPHCPLCLFHRVQPTLPDTADLSALTGS